MFVQDTEPLFALQLSRTEHMALISALLKSPEEQHHIAGFLGMEPNHNCLTLLDQDGTAATELKAGAAPSSRRQHGEEMSTHT